MVDTGRQERGSLDSETERHARYVAKWILSGDLDRAPYEEMARDGVEYARRALEIVDAGGR